MHRPNRSFLLVMRNRLQTNADRVLLSCLLIIACLILAGCEEKQQIDRSVIRSIKWIKLEEPLAKEQRLISGVLRPLEYSPLSFEVSGKIQKALVRVGDKVKAGDVLAELDKRPLVLAKRQADSALSATRARLVEQSGELKRHKKLFQEGWVAKAKLDKIQAAYNAAQSDVKAAQAEVDLRKRDLRLSVLRAPFDGVIAKKMIQSFEEVAAGQPVYRLDGIDGMKVEMQVPADMISKLERGQRASVIFPTVSGLTIQGLIHEIGSQADAGNSFPVTAILVETNPALRAGMSAEVTLRYRADTAQHGFMVPPTAILAGEKDEQFVFRFNVNTSKLHKVSVALAGVHNNEIGVTGDIKHGDVVAVAGVEFLSDGLEVRLMKRP